MSRPAIYTPEEATQRRREQIRNSVARHKERLTSLSPVEQAAYKARASLGEDFDPYTPEERESLERIRKLTRDLLEETERLNAQMVARYQELVTADPNAGVILGELLNGKQVRVQLKPH